MYTVVLFIEDAFTRVVYRIYKYARIICFNLSRKKCWFFFIFRKHLFYWIKNAVIHCWIERDKLALNNLRGVKIWKPNAIEHLFYLWSHFIVLSYVLWRKKMISANFKAYQREQGCCYICRKSSSGFAAFSRKYPKSILLFIMIECSLCRYSIYKTWNFLFEIRNPRFHK